MFGLSSLYSGAARYATGLGIGASARRGMGWAATGLGGVARGMEWMARTNPYARSAITGAALGGMYGAISDDTSVLGGMAKGALGGVALRGAYGGAMAGRAMYGLARAQGMGVGRSVAAAGVGLARGAYALGASSARFIGNTTTKAYNGFRSGMTVGGAGLI